jgi:hypothetical protein
MGSCDVISDHTSVASSVTPPARLPPPQVAVAVTHGSLLSTFKSWPPVLVSSP